MFSIRAVATIGVFSMITTTAMIAEAQPRHHAKDAAADTDPDAEADTDAPRSKSRSKAKGKARAKARTKAKAVDTDLDPDPDPDADTPRSKTRSKTRTKAKVKSMDTDGDVDPDLDSEQERAAAKDKEQAKADERERDRAREQEAAEAAAAAAGAKEAAAATASELTRDAGGGGGEAYHRGTLGFSIPFTGISDATGAAAGEPVPTVDIVYFLDDKAALDFIVGINVHRKHAVAAMGGASDSTLIGAAAGLGYRMYSASNGLRSFLEPQAVVSWADTSTTDSLSVNLGGSMGLERNITPWFSVSGEVGVTLNIVNSFQDLRLATAARLAANLYWH